MIWEFALVVVPCGGGKKGKKGGEKRKKGGEKRETK